MTPGPARPMVTVLPRNSPTPIAPPIAIMAICRGTSCRRSPSSVEGALAAGSVTARNPPGSPAPPAPPAPLALPALRGQGEDDDGRRTRTPLDPEVRRAARRDGDVLFAAGRVGHDAAAHRAAGVEAVERVAAARV